MVNDNYFPKEHIVITEEIKKRFLNELASKVELDKGIEKAVHIVNESPYFLTQSSCEGQNLMEGSSASSSHMPLPYLSIGVLYQAHELLDQLAERLKQDLKGKFYSLSLDYQVQAINVHKPTGMTIPSFQKYVSIFMKNKRGIETLEKTLSSFTQGSFEVVTNITVLEENLVERTRQDLDWMNAVMQRRKLSEESSPSEAWAFFQDLQQRMKASSLFSSVQVKKNESMAGFPPSHTVEFYWNEAVTEIEPLIRRLCSILTGGFINGIRFVPTNSGRFLHHCSFAFFEPKYAQLTSGLMKEWVEEYEKKVFI